MTYQIICFVAIHSTSTDNRHIRNKQNAPNKTKHNTTQQKTNVTYIGFHYQSQTLKNKTEKLTQYAIT